MTMRFLFVLVLLVSRLIASAQTGNYFLSNYTPSDERIDYVTFGMAQDNKGIIYFANKSGVLQFDGRNWTPIPTPGPLYTITSAGNEIFVGGLKGYGKIVWGTENVQVYQSLSQTQKGEVQIISSVATKDKVYFVSQHSVYVVVISTGVTEAVINATAKDLFTGIYDIHGKVYVGSERQGLLAVENNKLAPSKFELPEKLPVLFSSTLSGSTKVLIGTIGNRLFISDAAAGIHEIKPKDEIFLENNVMVNGSWVNDKLIAIGTLRGGVIFINPQTGITEEITNYFTGLPDNEIYTVLTDRNQGIWVAHDYGFTRIAPYLPFRSYSHYPGLSGNLLCALSFKNQIYVGTTLGLFNLVREEIYETEATTGPARSSAKPTPSKGLGGFFSFLKRDKKAANKTNTTTKSTAKGAAPKRVLKSLAYAFKKVEGVTGKVSQLTEVNGKLLASGITGVLEVTGLKSKTITSTPVRSVFMSSSLKQLLVSTHDQEIKTFEYNAAATNWQETHLLDTVQEDINYIFEDKLQNVWLCGRSHVFKIETVDEAITDMATIPFDNPSMDEPVGVAYGSEVYVTASGNINKYDFRGEKFVPFQSLSGSKKYFASAGYFWFYDGHLWRTVDPRMGDALKLKWLLLFQNIRFLAPVGQGEGVWVITAANELYKFSNSAVVTESAGYPLFLREVRGQQTRIVPSKTVSVSQLENTVAFDFIQPSYLGTKTVEYRFKVNGLTKDWSEWSPANNIVNFPFLPVGDYKVEVQTQDLVGNKSVTQIGFQVEPPYWKQSWFYAAEFAFFGMLVFVSIKLSSANSKYRYISGLLSVLTVIMLIQFVQTIAQSQISIKSTPVIDFFIQVFIALLVLPLEGYLRKFMNRSIENNLNVKANV